MKIVKEAACAIALLLVVTGTPSADEVDPCEVHSKAAPRLCSYEPTTIGYTHDSDDAGFMDFLVSVKYQLFPVWLTRGQNYFWSGIGDNSALYFAFTGRFGQYIGSRDSSPVVGKRFNPKLFYQYRYGEGYENHVAVAYAHESNGQSIDSLAEYQTALANNGDSNAVKDQLSRGWDYAEIVWKNILYQSEDKAQRTAPCDSAACQQDFCGNDECKKALCESDFCTGGRHKEDRRTTVVLYVDLKQFMRNGLLQGPQENYNAWENDSEGKNRDRVNGIAVMVKWIEQGKFGILEDLKVVTRFETGYREAFRYNTYRFEVGTKVLQLPLTVWGQTGYNSDLALYYKKVDSWGIAAEIGSF